MNDITHTRKRVHLSSIWPDALQARRAVPAIIRRKWQGDPRGAREVLLRWHSTVERLLGVEFDAGAIIRNNAPLPNFDADDKVVEHYINLLKLATSIDDRGLVNPITVIENLPGEYVIETGERRWLAHHLLALHIGGDWYTHIPARILSDLDIWRQADENGLRIELNAIGKARQLARLIMCMWQHENGVRFESLDALVLAGDCDRAYYAQALAYRVKRGQTQRVASAMGLNSYSHISRYKSLLALPDEIWQVADAEDWAEGRIRNYMIDYTANQADSVPESEPSVPKSAATLPNGKVKVREHYRGGVESPTPQPVGESPLCAIAAEADGVVQIFDALIQVACAVGDAEAVAAIQVLGYARPGDLVDFRAESDSIQRMIERAWGAVGEHSANIERLSHVR
jgi:hypothetical protein